MVIIECLHRDDVLHKDHVRIELLEHFIKDMSKLAQDIQNLVLDDKFSQQLVDDLFGSLFTADQDELKINREMYRLRIMDFEAAAQKIVNDFEPGSVLSQRFWHLPEDDQPRWYTGMAEAAWG